jgi:GR25 family glycosyltransferase involved in LPS biosynthesis
MQIHGLLITLNRNGSRKISIDNILSLLPDTEIIDAVDGRKMDILGNDKLPFDQKISIQTGQAHAYQSLTTPGAVGCYLSHVKCWERCVQLDKPVLVFEDDCVVTPAILKEIHKKLSTMPDDLEFGGIGYIPCQPNFVNDAWYTIPYLFKRGYVGAQCYYITPAGARKLLAYAFPINGHVDQYIGMLSRHPDIAFRAYCTGKSIYTCKDHLKQISDIGHSLQLMSILPSNSSFYIVWLCVFVLMLALIIVMAVMLYNR